MEEGAADENVEFQGKHCQRAREFRRRFFHLSLISIWHIQIAKAPKENAYLQCGPWQQSDYIAAELDANASSSGPSSRWYSLKMLALLHFLHGIYTVSPFPNGKDGVTTKGTQENERQDLFPFRLTRSKYLTWSAPRAAPFNIAPCSEPDAYAAADWLRPVYLFTVLSTDSQLSVTQLTPRAPFLKWAKLMYRTEV
jgi:hypothetical protein